ncbi:MAG: restriction endonuclease subunit S [Sedimentibacter sp.]|uniref:restriction endonuclease subunit S n=1 Tax=Sedimentibacter sp. TaxID=1960295 RepID=UPI003159015B
MINSNMKFVKIGDICQVVSGSTPKTNIEEYWNGNIKWLTPAEISDDSIIINNTERHLTNAGFKSANLRLLPEGTVLLSSRAPIGKVAIVGSPMSCNQGFKNLICKSEIFNYYLYYFLKYNTKYLNSLGRGATFKEISKEIVENIKIPLPSIENQKEIVKKLHILNHLISIRKQQINKLDLLVKSRFVEMFGDPVYNTIGWNVKNVGDLCFVTKLAGFEYTEYIKYQNSGDVIMIRGLNVKNNRLKLDDIYYIDSSVSDMLPRSQLKENDIVMTYVGVNIGDVALVDGYNRYHLAPNVAKISPHDLTNLNPIFFVYLLAFNKQNFASNATNTAKQALNMEKIRNLQIMLPPIDIQNQFADFVQQVDKQKFELQNSMNELNTLYNALLQKYFG